jgi:hypothetical protein
MTLALNLKEASEEYSCLCVLPTVVSKSSAHMAPEVQNYSHTKCRENSFVQPGQAETGIAGYFKNW